MSSEKAKVIARVFPSRTTATPDDELAFTDGPPFWRVPCDEVHVSCTFIWQNRRAEFLAKQWETAGYSVKIGGPAYDAPGGEFVPGRYLKPGYVFTSRGCNNSCWFCVVPQREGNIRELQITEGFNVLDSNLLQCSDDHIRKVAFMLGRQKERPEFTGGLDARAMKPWHAEMLFHLRPKSLYLAYDNHIDWKPVKRAWRQLQEAGFKASSHTVSCYVLVGYLSDTIGKALERVERVKAAGMVPFSMYYRGPGDEPKPANWATFQAKWSNPCKIYGKKND